MPGCYHWSVTCWSGNTELWPKNAAHLLLPTLNSNVRKQYKTKRKKKSSIVWDPRIYKTLFITGPSSDGSRSGNTGVAGWSKGAVLCSWAQPPTLSPVAEETASDVLVITTACDGSVKAFMFCNFLYWKCPEMATLLYNFSIRKFLPEPPRWLSGLRHLLQSFTTWVRFLRHTQEKKLFQTRPLTTIHAPWHTCIYVCSGTHTYTINK